MSLTRRVARNVQSARVGGSPGDPFSIPTNAESGSWTSSGVTVTPQMAMQLSVVYACTRIIANTVAGMPLDAVRMRGSYREQIQPAPKIVVDPFGGANSIAGITRRDGFARIMVSLLLRGNAFALVVARDVMQRPTQIRILHPDSVEVTVSDSGDRVYRVGQHILPSADVMHIVGLSEPGAPEGMAVIDVLRNAVGLGLAAEEYGAKFFANGAHLSGVIEVAGDLDKPRARQLKENFEANHGGMTNAHAIGVLTGGAEFKPISVTPEQAQFLGTRAAQNIDLAMAFGVPPHMLGQVDRTTSWGKGIEEQKLGFLNFTIGDWAGRIEDVWSAMLAAPHFAKFNMDSFLRPDTSTRYSTYMVARNSALMTPDEIRALENLPPLPDGVGGDAFAPLNSAHTVETVTDPNDDDLGDEGDPAAPPAAPAKGAAS